MDFELFGKKKLRKTGIGMDTELPIFYKQYCKSLEKNDIIKANIILEMILYEKSVKMEGKYESRK